MDGDGMGNSWVNSIGSSPGGGGGGGKRFVVGDLVEVRQTEVGLRGSWHPAVVVGVIKGKRKVQYEQLLTDDGSRKLVETVPVGGASDGDTLPVTSPRSTKSRIVLRPRPPATTYSPSHTWTEGLWVDCFYEDAWWEGILAEDIPSIVCSDVSSVTLKSWVNVFFPDEDDVSRMEVKQMRIGQEWDEDTGLWSVKECAQAPFVSRKKRGRPTKNDRPATGGSRKKRKLSRSPIEVVFPMDARDPDDELKDTEENGTGSALLDDSVVNDINNDIKDFSTPLASISSDINGIIKDLKDFSTPLASKSSDETAKLVPEGVKGSARPASSRRNVSTRKEEFPRASSQDNNVHVATKDNVRETADDNDLEARLDEVSMRKFLMDNGWKVTESTKKKKTRWTFRSPRSGENKQKTFSNLAAALNFQVVLEEGASHLESAPLDKDSVAVDAGNEIASVGEESSPDRKLNGAQRRSSLAVAGLSAKKSKRVRSHEAARQILKDNGWDVSPTKVDGHRWLYKSPESGSKRPILFTNLNAALAECKQQANPHGKEPISQHDDHERGKGSAPEVYKDGKTEEGSDSGLQHVDIKIAEGFDPQHDEEKTAAGSHSSPLLDDLKTEGSGSGAQDKDQKQAEGSQDDDPKTAEGERGLPSRAKSDVVRNLKSTAIPSPVVDRDHSDLDDDDELREVKVFVNSKRERTGVDLGQKLPSSGRSSLDGNAHHQKPFGTIADFMEKKDSYIMQVDTLGFLKEQMTIFCDKDDLVIKTRYNVEEKVPKLSGRCYGNMMSRYSLPVDVDRELISAELKNSKLHVNLPKSRSSRRKLVQIVVH